MKRICSCCGKEQDIHYDPYYLVEGEMLCEGCLLKRYPVEEITYYYSSYDEDYYDSISEALENIADEAYTAADEEEEDEEIH